MVFPSLLIISISDLQKWLIDSRNPWHWTCRVKPLIRIGTVFSNFQMCIAHTVENSCWMWDIPTGDHLGTLPNGCFLAVNHPVRRFLGGWCQGSVYSVVQKCEANVSLLYKNYIIGCILFLQSTTSVSPALGRFCDFVKFAERLVSGSFCSSAKMSSNNQIDVWQHSDAHQRHRHRHCHRHHHHQQQHHQHHHPRFGCLILYIGMQFMFLHVQAIAFNMLKRRIWRTGFLSEMSSMNLHESLAAPNILEVVVNPSSLANCSA